MFCCSLIALLLGQCGALAGAIKVRLLGGSSGIAAVLAPLLAPWSQLRWMAFGAALTLELFAGAAVFPYAYALDMPQVAAIGNWPICNALRGLTQPR